MILTVGIHALSSMAKLLRAPLNILSSVYPRRCACRALIYFFVSIFHNCMHLYRLKLLSFVDNDREKMVERIP